MTNLVTRFARARHAYWRAEDSTRLGALFCILQADVRSLPIAHGILRYEYKGTAPIRLDAWADAIDAAYLSGF